MTKYCRAYVWISVLFLAVSFVNSENMFFTFYPCLLVGMIPVNLLAYDEKSHWLSYSGTLPYTKAHIVSGKNVIGLLAQITMLLLTGIAQAVRMVHEQVFQWNHYLFLMTMLLLMSMIASSISLPFITVKQVISLSNQGESITWEMRANYNYEDYTFEKQGKTIYNRKYFIAEDSDLCLEVIGYKDTGRPDIVRLIDYNSPEGMKSYIDIRKDSAEDFLIEHGYYN